VSTVAIAALDRRGAMTNLAFLERNKALYPKLAIAHDRLDKTVKAWDAQFALKGTPRALIVDRNGRIAWTGNPFNGLAEALAAVVAGEKGGPERVLAERRARYEEFGPLAEEHERVSARENPAPKLVDVVERMLALDREFTRPFLPGLYAALVKAGMKDEAAAWGKRLVNELLADDEVLLNDLAWSIVDPKAADGPRDLAVAQRAAERANELSGGLDAAILDTLARVTWRDGRREEAMALQERALQAASWNADLKKALQATLDEYRSGLGS
jgi:tetratricopeptide (TPR) repeat protein